MNRRSMVCFLALAAINLLPRTPAEAAIPSVLKSRFQAGDPEAREIEIRADLQDNVPKVWDTVIQAIDDSRFEIALTDRDSGYVRTTKNRGVVVLKDYWYYELQITAKLIFKDREVDDGKGGKRKDRIVEKMRLTVVGEAVRVKKDRQTEYHRGWDRTLTADLFSDLKGKLGER